MSAEQQSSQSDSGVSTRKRMRAATPLHTATSEVTTVAMALEAAIQEIRLIREEQQQQRAAFDVLLRQRDEEIRRMERNPQPHNQLSPSINRSLENVISNNEGENIVHSRLGFKLKADTFDGTAPLREFLSQFLLIARANNWSDATKSIALAASLRGKARTVLETIENLENLSFEELESKLELRFGEGNLTQNYDSLFTNRRQKFGEDFASFGAELERLSRLAYPECPFVVRDKIACAQFVSAILNGFVRRTLQLEGITSLNLAIERAKTIKIIRGEGYEKEISDDTAEV